MIEIVEVKNQIPVEELNLKKMIHIVESSKNFEFYKSMVTRHSINNSEKIIKMIAKNVVTGVTEADIPAYEALIGMTDSYLRKKYGKEEGC